MIKYAETGNAEAMNLLGCYYVDGSCGFPKNDKLAWKWFKKSADLKNPNRMGFAGIGIARNKQHGLALLGMAAGIGSSIACNNMGEFYFKGFHSFLKDKIKAKHWLNKCVESDASSYFKNKANKLLEEIQSDNPAS